MILDDSVRHLSGFTGLPEAMFNLQTLARKFQADVGRRPRLSDSQAVAPEVHVESLLSSSFVGSHFCSPNGIYHIAPRLTGFVNHALDFTT